MREKKNLRGEKPADKRISQKTTLTFQSSGIETIDAKRRRHSIFPRSKHFHIVDKNHRKKYHFHFTFTPQKHDDRKSQKKVSLKIPSHIYILRGQKLIKITQNSVTRQFNFNWTKIGGNFQNWKMQKRHFWQFLNIAKTHIFSNFVLKILINEWEFYVWFSTTVLTKRQKFCL